MPKDRGLVARVRRRVGTSRLALVLPLAIIVASAVGAPAATLLDDASLEDAKQGLEHLYHARLEEATEAFERIRSRDTDSPAADFLLGGIEWHRVTTGPQGFTAGGPAEQRFFGRMDAAIEVGERRLEREPDHVATHFFVGGAYGYKARYLALQEEWWEAYRNGRKGVDHLERAVELDPGLDDAYLGLGIFHYYADVLPSVLKVLGFLVGMGGDAERGLEEIRRAVRGGELVGVEGRFFLAEIYTTFEQDHWTAYGFSRGLRDQYPENELFTWVNARVLDELHLTDRSLPEWQSLRRQAHDLRTQGFLDYRLARGLLFGGDFDGAARRLEELLEYGRLRSQRMTMWGRIRYGQALDFLGRHEEAIRQYQLAHDLDASGSGRDRTSERLSAGARDPSVISLTELDEVARILRDTGVGGAEAVRVTEERVTSPSRGMSRRETADYFRILATLAEAHLRRGAPEESVALVNRAMKGRTRPARAARAELLNVRARAHLRRDRRDAAREDLREARNASAGAARDRYDALGALIDVWGHASREAAVGDGDWVVSFEASDRAEITLEVEGDFLASGTRLPLSLDRGTWRGEFLLSSPEPISYRFVADDSIRRPDPETERVEMHGDEAWCVKTPQPKQTKSNSSR